MNSKWKFYSPDKKLVKSLMTKYGFSELLATILVNRNISTEEDIKIFLDPSRNDFRDPFDMPDMKIASDRIIEAIKKKEKVIIYGDYDVDGITSITVLKKFLAERGLEARL